MFVFLFNFVFPDEYQHIFQAAGKLLPPLGLNFLKFSLSLRYYSPRVELFNKVSESLIQFRINFWIKLFQITEYYKICGKTISSKVILENRAGGMAVIKYQWCYIAVFHRLEVINSTEPVLRILSNSGSGSGSGSEPP